MLTASTDPTVLGNITEKVEALAVDDRRLYWLGTDGNADGRKVSLRSCLKEQCVDSLVTYAADRVNEASGFGLENGEIYWFQPDQSGQWNLLACDVAGCGKQPRNVGFGTPSAPGISAFTPEALYFCSTLDGLRRVSLSGDAASNKLDSDAAHGCNSLTVGGGYVYWSVSTAGPLYGIATIGRIRSDGTGPVETIADNLEMLPSSNDEYPSNVVAVDETSVYWSQGALRGSIARCPLSGCVEAPQILAAPIRSPTTLLLNGSEIYWQHGTSTQGNAVSTCSVAQCVLTEPIVQRLESANVLAVDDRYFYTATTTQRLSADAYWTDPIAEIRRFPK